MHQQLFYLFCFLFVLFHIALSINSIRSYLISKVGEKPFSGIFSLMSFITLGGAIFMYAKYDVQGPKLYDLNPILVAIIYGSMLISFILLFLSFDNPSPIGMVPAKVVEPKGVLRITEHPQNMAIAAFGFAHAIAACTMGGFVFYGSFFALGLLGAFHQTHNKSLDKDPAIQDFLSKTSVIPFWAIIKGKNKLVLSELKVKFIIFAIAAYGISVVIHKVVK